MINFTFKNDTKVIFGKETENHVGAETASIGKKVLLHFGGGSIKKSGLYDRVIKSLEAAGVTIVELSGVKPNPRLSLVEKGIKICKEEAIDAILAVGGGSVIDSAKAIAVGALDDGDVWDFYLGKRPVEKALPLGVVLTIPAAGSETGAGSVITNEAGWYKRSASGEAMRPRFAILNPQLTFTLPEYQTACGIVDMFAHILERYFTKTPNVEVTDRMSEGLMTVMIDNAPIVLENPEDYDARAEIMWAGTLAHNNLLSTGKIGDWGSHDIEHELSAIYDIAHGAGLAIVFPAWMDYVYKEDIPRFAQYANRVWNIDIDPFNIEKAAKEGIVRTREFFQSIGMPVTLEDAHIPADRIEEMAEKATASGKLGNFLALSKEDVMAILELAK